MSESLQLLDPNRYILAQVFSDVLKNQFAQSSNVDDVFFLLEKPPAEHPGDYSLPVFRFAKVLRKAPPQIATDFKEALLQQNHPLIRDVETIQGFVNVLVDKELYTQNSLNHFKSKNLSQILSDPLKHKTKVMIEYSQPNTHKEFHVGHLRNVCLGDALIRLFGSLGYQVIAANYYGDEGTHIAKCIWYIKKFNLQPSVSDNKGAWLGIQYSKADQYLAAANAEDKKIYEQEVSEILRQIESKKGDIYSFWQETRQWSLDEFERIYKWIGARFDIRFYESEVSEGSQKIVDEYLKKNIFIISEGAIGIDLKPYGLGFMILRKKDGNTLYGTKDLVLAGKKFDEFNIDRSIYIVASEQNHHFKQVFKTLELMGFEQAKSCYHLSYGMVVLPDGKMSSRAGNTIAFGTLRKQLEQIFAEQLKKYETEWPAEEIHAAIEKLSIATMRFGMLSSDANKDVVFNLDDWTSFEGCSGPYLLYSYARAQSILRKVSDEYKLNDFTLFKAADIADDISFDLLRSINDLAYTIYNSTEHYRVSSIAQTLYSMAKSFNRFYRELKILKAESDDLRQSRATLVYTFSKIFAEGLKLLGIEPLDRM